MKRVHVLELEDLPWFPGWIRTSMTNLIVVFSRMIGVTSVLASEVGRALKQSGTDHIVDLGSGAGGVMPDVLRELRQDPANAHVRLTMTDLYPNQDAVRRFAASEDDALHYTPESVDALDLASAPPGLKTMVNCFHHMPPDKARAILSSALEHRQPFLIYEMGENKIPFAVWCLLLPLGLTLVGSMVFFLTPFVRPLTFRQLFFTYVIPIIPICYAWDGQASMPRLYSMEDLDELLEGLDAPDYRWEKGEAKSESGRALGTYLLGTPR